MQSPLNSQPERATVAQRFFDHYPVFYETAQAGPHPNRMNSRHEVIIEPHRELLQGATVLDLASHDGRWSFAALEAGAEKVIGVEARGELVQRARDSFEELGVDKDRYEFIAGDIFETLPRLSKKIDTIFCLGFFYHVHNHVALLTELQRFEARRLFLDTNISMLDDNVVELRYDNAAKPGDAFWDASTKDNKIIVGWPSRKALAMMLGHFGYAWKELDWSGHVQRDRSGIEEYDEGWRISLLAEKS